MTIEDAIIALKPYQPEPPQKALMFIRNNWNEAEPVLLAEIDRCLADPVLAEPSALFFYSLYLCAEMRCKAAFERYMEICRLQDLLRDYLIGDVLTEALSQMLALTCVNLIDELKALVEDDAAYELVRSTGLDALHDLVVIDVHPQKELSRYCIDLLAERLEKRPTYIWDVAISLAEKLRLVETLPLIETAYRCGWANPGLQSFESVRDGMAQVLTAAELSDWREKAEGFKTEREMDFFVRNWSKGHSKAEEYSAHLLQEARGQIQHSQRSAGSKVKIGRNTLCPCGSGKKYKNAASIKKILL